MTTDPAHVGGSSRGRAGRVTTETRDRVLMVGIDRAEKRNALTSDILSGLAAAYAGFDLTQLKDAVDSDVLGFGEDGFDPFGLSGRRLSKPLVVALHGACLAGGLEIALNGDVLVAAERTLLGQPEVTRGIFAFGGGVIRWPERVGWGNAQRYLLTGDTLTAEEAYRIGLVQDLVPARGERGTARSNKSHGRTQTPGGQDRRRRRGRGVVCRKAGGELRGPLGLDISRSLVV